MEHQKAITKTYNYTTPDGQDCAKKLLHTTKVAAVFSGFASLIDIVGISHTKTIGDSLGRVVIYTAPAITLAAVYSGTSCIVGDLRGKDNAVNHAIGGAAAGTTLGIMKSNWRFGVGFALAFGLVGSILKKMSLVDEHLIPRRSEIQYQSKTLPGPYVIGPRREVKAPTDY